MYVTEKNVFLLGDFNIDLLTGFSSNFKDTMYSIGLYPLITRSTKITTHSATVIDNMFTSLIKNDLVVGIIIDDTNDHLPIFGLYRLSDTNKHKKQTFIYRFKINNISLDLLIM